MRPRDFLCEHARTVQCTVVYMPHVHVLYGTYICTDFRAVSPSYIYRSYVKLLRLEIIQVQTLLTSQEGMLTIIRGNLPQN